MATLTAMMVLPALISTGLLWATVKVVTELPEPGKKKSKKRRRRRRR